MRDIKRPLAALSALALLLSLAACGDRPGGGQSGSGEAQSQSQISQSAGPEEAGGSGSPSEDDASSQAPEDAQPAELSQSEETQSGPITEEEPEMLKMEITVGEATFSATLYDNPAAKALMELLPMTLDMSELNGNEKYHYLSGGLPTDSGRPAGIHAGDIMLYGDSCLVLFYKSFSTTYSYTALGRIDDPSGLAAAVGNGDVQISFRKAG